MKNDPTITTAEVGRGKTDAHIILMDEICAASSLRKAMDNLPAAERTIGASFSVESGEAGA